MEVAFLLEVVLGVLLGVLLDSGEEEVTTRVGGVGGSDKLAGVVEGVVGDTRR